MANPEKEKEWDNSTGSCALIFYFFDEVYYYFTIKSYSDLGIELLQKEYKILTITQTEMTS